MSENVAIIIANEGYQPIEYSIPKKILANAGYIVTTASDLPALAVASDNSTTKVDLVINDIVVEEYAAIIFAGGAGALDHLDNEETYKLIRKADKKKLIIGAICISTRILANAGILKGKKATGWDKDGELAGIYKKAGVIYEQQGVVVDGRYVTAVDPSVAEAFANQLVTMLEEKK